MTTKFTPGPWRLHDMEKATIVAGRPGGEVANCCNGFGDQNANAHLIAAAPELYEALQKARNTLAGCGLEHIAGDICDAALAKARGEQ